MTQRTIGHTAAIDTSAFSSGWCPDCDLASVVIDARDGGYVWAECTECGVGWTLHDAPAQGTDRGTESGSAVRRAA